MMRRLSSVALVLAAALLVSAAKPAAKPTAKEVKRTPYPPTSDYDVRQIEGWRVYVHKELLTTEKKVGAEAMKLLRVKLFDINRVMPPKALADLHKVRIWISASDRQKRHGCACYHPSRGWLEANGYNPEKAGCVDLLNAANFVEWTRRTQPWMVLHELAHAYHHQFLEGGHANKDLRAAYKQMVAGKKYESVLYYNGRKRRAYALNNPQEYFAELTEAYFGTNDFYPFVRPEVMEHDPEMYKLLRKLWGDQRR